MPNKDLLKLEAKRAKGMDLAEPCEGVSADILSHKAALVAPMMLAKSHCTYEDKSGISPSCRFLMSAGYAADERTAASSRKASER